MKHCKRRNERWAVPNLLMTKQQLLPSIQSPHDLRELSLPQLEKLADEMREVLCNLVSCRSAHFASN
jgi:1-deoxy-D-xylulose-5-phosphate synthase